MNSIYLYGTIGEDWWDDMAMTAGQFTKELNAYGGEPVDIFVNSPGGNVFDGSTIYSAIKRYPGRVTAHIDGLAASAASYCILSADEVLVSPSATMMIHNAWISATGSAEELRETADVLEKLDSTITGIYRSKTGMGQDEIERMMLAETWMTAAECVEMGFADGFGEDKAIAAHVNKALFARYKHVPVFADAAVGSACNGAARIGGEGSGDAPKRPEGASFVVINSKLYKIGEEDA